MLYPLALLPLALPLPGTPSDSLVPRIESGQVFQRSLTISTEFELVEESAIQDGEEIPGDMMPNTERTAESTIDLDVEDHVLKADEEGVVSMRREYTTASGNWSFEMSMEDMEGMGGMEPVSEGEDFTNPVEGEAVLFDRKEDELVAKLPEESPLEEEDLLGLPSDLSFAFLLPEDGDVAEEASWTVDPEHILELADEAAFLPSGDMGPMMMAEEGGDLIPEGAEFEGEITLTHAGYREVDGRNHVVVSIGADCSMAASYSPDMGMGGDEEVPEGMIVPDNVEIDLETTYEGEGELLWDVEGGFIAGLSGKFELERTTHTSMSFEIEGMGAMDMEQAEVEDGLVELSYTCRLSK